MNLTVLTTEIRQLDGLYSLNDLHRAAGDEKKHQPALFMRNDQTKALIEEIHSTDSQTAAKSINGGPNRGTYVCKELVYAYAMWISPKFNLAVIRAFDAMQTAVSPAPTLRNIKDSYALAAALLPEIAEVIQSGLEGTNRRWFLSFDYHHQPRIQTITEDACMMSHSEFLKYLLSADGAPLKNEELEVFINAATRKLASRAAFYQQRAMTKQ